MNITEIIRAQVLGGAPVEQTEALVRTLANANGCVPDVEWALREMEAIYASNGRRGITETVRAYVDSSVGWFSYRDIDMELQFVTPQDKHVRKTALIRLAKDGILERHRSKDGVYRRKESGLEIIDWKHADLREIDIQWPFELERWEITYPGTLDVIAGSSGAGKTAYMLNFLKLNHEQNVVRYMTSEMSAQQLRHRLLKMDADAANWEFEPIRCSSNFADKILADSINIIDYLEVDGDNPSGIVNELREIFDALKTGFVLVGLQKKGNTTLYKKDGSPYSIRNELGRGGAFSMEKARLYLSMDYNELSVVKASNRRDDDAASLKGKRWSFNLYKGCIFENIQPIYGDREE